MYKTKAEIDNNQGVNVHDGDHPEDVIGFAVVAFVLVNPPLLANLFLPAPCASHSHRVSKLPLSLCPIFHKLFHLGIQNVILVKCLLVFHYSR